MDPTLVAVAVIALVKPVISFGSNVAASATGSALYNFIKGRFKKPAALEAIEDVEKKPDDEDNWDALKIQIKKALKEDEDFRNELFKLLPDEVISKDVEQEANVSGSGHKLVQSAGDKNKITIG